MLNSNYQHKWLVTITFVFITLFVTGCGSRKNDDIMSTTQTVSLQRGSLTAVVGATGTVRSNQSALVNWQTSGRVEKVLVALGKTVQPNALLASLDPTSLTQNLIQAKADLINAQSALEEIQKPQPLKIAQAETVLAEAQSALNTLMHPSPLAIAQAETNLYNAQTALENLLNPDTLVITQAEQLVLDAQKVVDDAQVKVDRLQYPRGTNSQINAARATYVLAQSEVDRLQKVYEQTNGSPDQDPVKARALSDLDAAKVKRDRALGNLNWYEAVWSPEDILDRNADLALAQARLADAEKNLETLTNPSLQDIELAKAHIVEAQDAINTLKNPTSIDIELAKQKVIDAQETLDKAKNGPTSDDLAVAETRIVVAQATLNQIQLTAPFAGIITDIQVMPGDMVSLGHFGFRIDDLSTLFVDLQVSEIDVFNIKVGQQVNISLDAIPDKEYAGKVTDIGLVGSTISGVVYFPVTVQLTNADNLVKVGMTAVANIIISKVDDVLLVPNRAIQIKDGNKIIYVWSQNEDQYLEVPVRVGLSSDTMTEINSEELNVGDEILVTIPTSFQGAGSMFGGSGSGGHP